MCQFFSFVTEPDGHPNERYYFNWKQRKKDFEGGDSHDHIISFYKLDEGKCNSYEYNPLTQKFVVDQQNNSIDDRVQAEKWVEGLDWKKIVKPLIVKPIINPFNGVPKVKQVTEEHIGWLNDFIKIGAYVRAYVRDSVGTSVGASVGDSVRASVWASVWASVGDSVRDSVWDSVEASVRDSVWASVGAYVSSFFDSNYEHDFTSYIRLWESGLVPSFDGNAWRLHSGKNADIVYERE